MSSGNLAGTEAVIGVLNKRCADGNVGNLWSAATMFDVGASSLKQVARVLQPMRSSTTPAVPISSFQTLDRVPVEDLPEEALLFLLGSRYCETDRLSETAWNLFGQTPAGWFRRSATMSIVTSR